MNKIKGFFTIIYCLTIMTASLVVFLASSCLGQIFAKAQNPEIGLTILLAGAIASFCCILTIKNTLLNPNKI